MQKFFWLAVFQSAGGPTDRGFMMPTVHTRSGVVEVQPGQPTSDLASAIVRRCSSDDVEGGPVPRTALLVNLVIQPEYLVGDVK